MAWDAWGGDAGESWVNGLNSRLSNRALSGQIGISDLDDTLVVAGELNSKVYEWIDSQDVDLVIVTGRHEKDRASTVDLLNRLDVEYESLVMQPDDMQDSAKFKGDVARQFIADGLDVVFVVENNGQARQAYEAAGVEAVYSPEVLSKRQVGQLEAVGMSKDELVAKVQELQGEVLELVGHLVETVSDLSDLVEATVEPIMPIENVMPEVEVEVDAVRFVEPVKVAELHERGERVEQGIERRELHDLELRVVGCCLMFAG